MRPFSMPTIEARGMRMESLMRRVSSTPPWGGGTMEALCTSPMETPFMVTREALARPEALTRRTFTS